MSRDPLEQLDGHCVEVQPPLPELPPECSMSTHCVLNETEVPIIAQTAVPMYTDSCTCADQNEFRSLSNCENYPNEDEIDDDCSMDDEDTDIILR